ncbi:hypothetical protein [Candidatus Protochlamydia phocaeensis]|uniref:hypothetical protein n=1 Tax=Candidatus Protochlamydia phocaeensis TaxID=1414722 RepID=UPI000839A480|nr:hypothetical protein [Candidatus Protochlamydia phocaeensis]
MKEKNTTTSEEEERQEGDEKDADSGESGRGMGSKVELHIIFNLSKYKGKFKAKENKENWLTRQ